MITATIPAILHVKLGVLDAGKGWIVKGDARKMGMGRENTQTQSGGVGKTRVAAPELAEN